MKDLLKLDLVKGRIDIGHEGSEVILVIGKRTDDNVPITNTVSLESLQHMISHLTRSECHCSLSILQSNFFTKLSLTSEIILRYKLYTLIVVSISSVFSGEVTTLMNIFLSVSSFSPKP